MDILGISAHFHDAAAALVRDGVIVAATQEERFSRRKHDAAFPEQAIRWCLDRGGVGPDGPDAVAFYDKPVRKFARILDTSRAIAPRGLGTFVAAMPGWLKEKLWVPARVEAALARAGRRATAPLFFTEHHEAHAASAFFPSPFDRAAILTVDGVGEWATAAIGRGADRRLELLQEMAFPHSLGLLYSAFTAYCGFEVNEGEYKLMGLAARGTPSQASVILDKLVDLKADGSLRLNMDYFGYLDGTRMTTERFHRLFGGAPRRPDEPVDGRIADLAASVQAVTEEAVLRMARHARTVAGEDRLVMAGGVALNCVANGHLLRAEPGLELWVQPAAGDAGGAIGAALAVWHGEFNGSRQPDLGQDGMHGAALGPEVGDAAAETWVRGTGVRWRRLEADRRPGEIARLLAAGRIVGVVEGPMEFGPRALGHRSLLADPRDPAMRERLNARIKEREAFRPFAPAVLAEEAGEWFELDGPSPYMLVAAPVRPARRDTIPAVVHVDGSARIQTVAAVDHPRFHAVLSSFRDMTGVPILLNTSFNGRGEPIVCTAADAWDCFVRHGIDDLVLESFHVAREDLPARPGGAA